MPNRLPAPPISNQASSQANPNHRRMNNWPSYLYSQSTPEERFEITLLMLKRIERRRKIVALGRAAQIVWRFLPYPLVQRRRRQESITFINRRAQYGRVTPGLAITISTSMMFVTFLSLALATKSPVFLAMIPTFAILITSGLQKLQLAEVAKQSAAWHEIGS